MARNAKRTTNKQADDFWGHDAEELPRADVESMQLTGKRIKLYKVWVVSSVVLLPVALLAIISFLPKFLEPTVVPPVQANQLDSPTKAAAMKSVQDWLNKQPSPMPGGRILSWDGADVQAEPKTTTNDKGDVEEIQGLQLNNLTLISPSGSLFTTQVQVAYSPIRGAKVIGDPTLIPRAPDDKQNWPNLKAWPDLVPTSKLDPVEQAANAWAKAFTSGDPDALRLAVGDTNANRSYVPLVQVAATSVSIGDVAARPLPPEAAKDAKPSQVIARVSFGVTWEGQDMGNSQTPSRVTYDVLIDKADTAAPQIVAWGGAGTGETLKPYMNAVEGRKITSGTIDQALPKAAGK
ncbi:hypothetical protein IV500_04595 [Paeniglutamicibacter antarcticus]|uniref:Uncharacterized protein n=2 Tax=Arthrobacter terrae TaxID=2935737 RepID=A0A931CPN3_9MICC|nr:hypothetical protein [Arthrobacter terrae]